MPDSRWQPPKVIEVVPELAEQLQHGLDELMTEEDSGFDAVLLASLREQVSELRILSLCGCADDFCGSFTTLGSPDIRRTTDAVTIPLPDDSLILDVQDGRISYVEVLFQPEIRAKLRARFGKE